MIEDDVKDYVLEYHANKLQLLPLIYRPRKLIALLGRGTGKTEEIVTARLYEFIHLMPGGITLVGCDSFKHLAQTIIPAILTSLKKKGLKEGENYWCNVFPPPGVPRPMQVITEADGFIFFDTGHAFCFVSTNFQSHANGKSVDAGVFEEAKLLKWNRVKEILLMIRGNKRYFGNLWCHHSLTVVSDMSDDPEHWTYKYEDKMDKRVLRLIASYEYQLQKLENELEETGNKKRIDILQNKIEKLEEKLNFWRRKATLFLVGTSIQNMHVLGYDVIGDYLSNPRKDVMLNVLSIKPKASNKYYYQYFRVEKHGVVYKDWDYIRTLKDKSILDCRIDTGSDQHRPLDICLDYNNNVISLSFGQLFTTKFRGLGEFFSEAEKTKIKDCVRQFCKYHRFRTLKEVVFYYDDNADWLDAGRDQTFKEIVEETFEEENWEYTSIKYPRLTHDERFEIWQKILTDDPTAPFGLEIEEESCPNTIKALKAVQKIVRKKKVVDKKTKKETYKDVVEKVKTSELDKQGKRMAVEEQPHITEALDGLIVAHWIAKTEKKTFSMPIRQINK